MKDDERKLLLALADRSRQHAAVGGFTSAAERPRADLIGEAIGIHPKRLNRILEKWVDKGWWSYGVSMEGGWIEPAGLGAAGREEHG